MRMLSRTLAVAGLLVTPLVACDDGGPAYDQDLAHYAFEKAHVAHLPGGERLAVGSLTGHDLTVQWGDGDGWSTPQKVADEPLWTHDLRLREREGTAAISADFWEQEKLDDDYSPRRSVIVVCRDHTCSAAQHPEGLSSAHVADDGSLVDFGMSDHSVAFWEDGRFRTHSITGLPAERAIQTLPDGSWLATGARRAGDLCHYDLYAAPRATVAFSRVATGPGFPDARCRAYAPELEPGDPDRVGVYVDSSVDRLVFVRHDGAWRADVPEVRPIAYRDTQGRSTIAPMDIDVGGGRALLGSPDLRHVVVQLRPAGSETWSSPRTVATAPAGHLCRWARSSSTTTGSAMAVVYCYPEDLAWRPSVEQYAPVALVLASDDGRQWTRASLAHPAHEGGSGGEDYLLAAGARKSLLWLKGTGHLKTIHLRSDPLWDSLVVVDHGTRLLRLIGNGDRSAMCRPSWTVTDIDARVWPAATPVPPRIQRYLDRGTCEFDGWPSQHGRIEAGAYGGIFQWEFALVPRGDGYVVH